MKRIFALLSVITMLFCLFTICPSAETAKAYVTIADQNGKLVLAYEEITLSDTDNDGSLTVNDALYIAHQEHYKGGAENGYASAETDFGLSLTKLWGVSDISFGYYHNNASCMSLKDPVEDGSHITAFAYTDTETFSDTYTFFDIYTISAKVNEEIDLTLLGVGFNEKFETVISPIENAVITVNGESTEYKTNSDGKVTVKVDKGGEHIISAKSESQTIVAPVCKASITGEEKANKNNGVIITICVIAVIALAGAILIIRKKGNEK